MSTQRAPKSCLTECLRQGASQCNTLLGQKSVPRVDVAVSQKSLPQTAVASICSNDMGRSYGELSSSIYDRHPSVKGVNWLENRSGCDILGQLQFSPPARPGNPLPKNDFFGTSAHRRYTTEVVQYTKTLYDPGFAVIGFGVEADGNQLVNESL